MFQHKKKSSAPGALILLLVIVNAIILKEGLITSSGWYGWLSLSVPALLISLLWNRIPGIKE